MAKRRKRGGMNIAAIETAAAGMTKKELQEVGSEALASAAQQQLAVDKILTGFQSTRGLNDEHVEKLMESIEALGLLQPIVVDTENQLLCGGHRLAAITLLKERSPTLFKELFGDGVLVRVVSFAASAEPERALAVEVAENEKRRDYTSREVKELAERLRQQGFKFHRGARRKRGLVALSEIVGKSERQVRRLLTETEEEIVDAESGEDKAIDALRRALTKFTKVNVEDEELVEIQTQVKELVDRLEQLSNERNQGVSD